MSLGGAGRQDGAFRGDAPQRLAHLSARFGEMVAHPLDRAVDAVVEGAEDGGALHEAKVRQAFEFGLDTGDPVRRGRIVQPVALGEEASAEAVVLVGEDDPGSGARRRQRRGKAGRAAADHQEVAMEETLVIGVGIGLHRQAAEPGRAADRRLIEFFPERTGPHEGLVIEAGGQEIGKVIVHRQRVEGKRGPAVLAAGFQPVEELHHGGAGIGLVPRAGAQFHQRVRLFGAGGEDAARAVILEAAADEAHAVRQKRRGERIAGMALIQLAVEGEAQRLAAVDRSALEPHAAPAFARSATSRARSAPRISWVTVLRVTMSQLRSPCSWNHSSR